MVEYHDGYSAGAPYLGFSRGDFIANILGAALPIAQEYVPSLDYVRFKFSFYRTRLSMIMEEILLMIIRQLIIG